MDWDDPSVTIKPLNRRITLPARGVDREISDQLAEIYRTILGGIREYVEGEALVNPETGEVITITLYDGIGWGDDYIDDNPNWEKEVSGCIATFHPKGDAR